MTVDIASMVSNNLNIWTMAVERKSSAGRGTGMRLNVYGINRLRALIMDLAVRGKLLAQDQSDEPAAAILSRIKAKPSSVKPFEIPDSWTWVAVGSIGRSRLGKMLDKAKNKGSKRRYLRNANVRWFDFDLRDVLEMPFEDSELEEFRLKRGDVLICEGGEPGRTAVWDERDEGVLFQKAIHRLRFDQGVFPHYFAYFMKASADNGALARYFTGSGIQHFTGRSLDRMPFPLPPVAEQQRIVAKVDQLMGLCDALEAESAAAMVAHQALVEALLATLTASNDVADLATNWSRLEVHFDTLFTTEASVDSLQQTILKLAVSGWLVPQNPIDEPATQILCRIRSSSRVRPESLESRKAPSLGNIPAGWVTARLSEVVTAMDSGWSPACLEVPSDDPDVWGVLKTTAVQSLRYEAHQNKALPPGLIARPDAETRAGDILITRAGPTNRVGICCYVENTRPRLMISDKIIRFRSLSPDIHGGFLALVLTYGPSAHHIEAAKSGMAASQVNISQAKLRETPICLPPIEEQRRILQRVGQMIGGCAALKEHIAEAAKTQKHLADTIVIAAAA